MYIKRTLGTAWPVVSTTIMAALAISEQLPAQTQRPHSASSRMVVFDAPNAGKVSVPACAPFCGTQPLANNDEGAIVGTYTDANVVPHGFLRISGGDSCPL